MKTAIQFIIPLLCIVLLSSCDTEQIRKRRMELDSFIENQKQKYGVDPEKFNTTKKSLVDFILRIEYMYDAELDTFKLDEGVLSFRFYLKEGDPYFEGANAKYINDILTGYFILFHKKGATVRSVEEKKQSSKILDFRESLNDSTSHRYDLRIKSKFFYTKKTSVVKAKYWRSPLYWILINSDTLEIADTLKLKVIIIDEGIERYTVQLNTEGGNNEWNGTKPFDEKFLHSKICDRLGIQSIKGVLELTDQKGIKTIDKFEYRYIVLKKAESR